MDAELATVDLTSQSFVGRWNGLVSKTNWEKGRIILQWREAMAASDTPAAETSDETWALRVGRVTSQHVGRLRRVFERFGEVADEYEGLYWSHFCGALDWDDAEMWLEGALQNSWSVAAMRRARWETLGSIEENRPDDGDIIASELDEDYQSADDETPSVLSGEIDSVDPLNASTSPRSHTEGGTSGESQVSAGRQKGTSEEGAAIYADEQEPTVDFVQPFKDIASLPDDIAEAFDAFKLAILSHKTDGWQQIALDDLLGTLVSLKELALAPSGDESSPF